MNKSRKALRKVWMVIALIRDVVLTDQGISLLEGNSWPGVSLHQVHHPLLADPQVKAFYQYYGAVK